MAVENAESSRKTTVLGDFELKRKLGQGGMGVVYLGHQISLDRDCAVKVLSKELAAKPGFVDRFVREARAMAKIDHPSVVTCYAVSEDKGHHFVAMELIDGKSMQVWLDQLGKLPVADALLVTIICADALHYAHEKNMIHRDVKPDNILVTSKGVIKVSDLGLAKSVDDEDHSLTQSGTGLGTPHYMAPEQARNAKRVDRRCDVYALGCTLYHFVTGKPPFSGGSVLELITNKEKGVFTPAHRVNNQVPERLSLMIDKAMASDPRARYQTCADFIKDLESLGLAGESLSFIDPSLRTAVGRPGGAGGQRSAVGMRTAPGVGASTRVAPAGTMVSGAGSTASKSGVGSGSVLAESRAEAQWFVRSVDEKGKPVVTKLSAAQILQALKGDRLHEKTQASLQAKGPFLPLAQIPVFETEARRMLTRKQSHARDSNLAAQYEKLAKQYERRKYWRFLGRMVDGTLGIVGLAIWLALVAGVGVGLYFLVPIVYRMLAGQVGL